MSEIKFVILRDNQGRLRHFKSDWKHHTTIAKDNGFDYSDVVEAGLFLDKRLYILESVYLEHLRRRAVNYIGNRLNDYQDIRLTAWLKGRTLESQLYYSKEPILKEGD
jgi:hypothetical protein